MGIELALFSVGVAVAIIIFILEKTMKIMPLWLTVVLSAISASLIGSACLQFAGLYSFKSVLFLQIGVVVVAVLIYSFIKRKAQNKVNEALQLRLQKLEENNKQSAHRPSEMIQPTVGIDSENSTIIAPGLKIRNQDKSIIDKGSIFVIPDAEIEDNRGKRDGQEK